MSNVNYRIKDIKTKKEDIVHINRMKLVPEDQEKRENEELIDKIFGQSDEEEFYGFTEEEIRGDEEAEIGESNTVRKNPKREAQGLSVLQMMVVLMQFLILVGQIPSTSTTGGPNIGPLYDCDTSALKGIFTDLNTCKEDLHLAKVTKFKAEIGKYKKHTSKVNLFYCDP